MHLNNTQVRDSDLLLQKRFFHSPTRHAFVCTFVYHSLMSSRPPDCLIGQTDIWTGSGRTRLLNGNASDGNAYYAFNGFPSAMDHRHRLIRLEILQWRRRPLSATAEFVVHTLCTDRTNSRNPAATYDAITKLVFEFSSMSKVDRKEKQSTFHFFEEPGSSNETSRFHFGTSIYRDFSIFF